MAVNIVARRLSNQHLAGNPLEAAEQIVAHLGAVQSQDYYGALWAVGQRLKTAEEATIEAAFNIGAILRTHIMRPTWHFVHPADIRWLQALTAPRVHVVNGYMYRQLELNDDVFRQSHRVIVDALSKAGYLTREELGDAMETAGIPARGMRLSYLVMRAELEALICSGPRRGKQFTYALLDERVPPAPPLTEEEALAELTRRYFRSHGPATVADFAYWSGLTKTQARRGLALLKGQLVEETVGDLDYWFDDSQSVHVLPSPSVHFLPNYDEYLSSHRDSSPVLDPAHDQYIEKQNPLFAHWLIVNGRILGTWRRDFEKDHVHLTIRRFVALDAAQEKAVREAGERFGRFWNLPVVWEWLTAGE